MAGRAIHRGKVWYTSWPDQPVYSVVTFARVWRTLAADSLAETAAPDVLLVRYEDLVQRGDVIDAPEAHLNLQIDRSVLGNRISGAETAKKLPHPGARMEALENWLVRRVTGSVARTLNYK